MKARAAERTVAAVTHRLAGLVQHEFSVEEEAAAEAVTKGRQAVRARRLVGCGREIMIIKERILFLHR